MKDVLESLGVRPCKVCHQMPNYEDDGPNMNWIGCSMSGDCEEEPITMGDNLTLAEAAEEWNRLYAEPLP